MNEKIKFGFGQIANATPKIATWVFRIILYAAAIVNIFLQVIDEIPPDVKAIVGKYSVYAVTLTHTLTRMFGIEVTGPDYNNYKNNKS